MRSGEAKSLTGIFMVIYGSLLCLVVGLFTVPPVAVVVY